MPLKIGRCKYQLFCYSHIDITTQLLDHASIKQEATMFSDAQLAALIMASPFLLLSIVWAAGDMLINRRAR